MNLVNRTKEYFKVDLDEIEKEVKKIDGNVEFVKVSEAIEYHQTLEILKQQLDEESMRTDAQFHDASDYSTFYLHLRRTLMTYFSRSSGV